MVASYYRRDISDKAWALIEPYTIGNKGTWGGNAKDTRLFINAVFWILRTGAPWCDLPPDYCNWNTVQRRFCRWRDKGIGETILEAIVDGPDFESCSHLALSCLLWPLAAVLETAKTLVLQRILDAPAGIDQLHIRKNQSSN